MEPVTTPPDPTEAPEREASRSWVRDLVVAAVVIVVLEVVAVPLGLLWGHLAPHPLYSVNGNSLNLAEDSAKPLVRGDGLFLLITGVAGIIAGIVAFFTVRRAEIGATLGLALGGLAGGWLAWRVGHAWTGGVQPLALALKPDNTKVHLAADLGARTVLVSWAVAGVAMHGILYAVTWPAKPKPALEPDGMSQPWPRPAAPPVAEA
jgi:hypothetical protein